MNFLAHIYLSGVDSEIKIGNFIADDIKGSNYKKYPDKIALGIIIHRAIDTFADQHSIYSMSKTRLTEKYGHYSGIVVDIFFDHFLALHWNKFSNQNFKAYCRNFYMNLALHTSILTRRSRFIMPYIIIRDWLGSYTEIDNIASVLARMSRRTSLPPESQFAKKILLENYENFQKEFFEFMPQIIFMVEEKFKIKQDHLILP
jgi:acyl carrier protein phosphodiesterase